MKKLLSIVVSAVMLFTMAACGTTTEDPAKNAQNQTGTNQEVQQKHLAIKEGTGFGSGVAIVCLQGEKELSVIDEMGNVQFKTKGNVYNSTTFVQDVAIISQSVSNDVICRKDGTIYEPEVFGCTGVYHLSSLGRQKLLDDGLIVMENEDENTAGVLGLDLEWVVPLSADFYNKLEDLDFCEAYADGYYIAKDRRNAYYYLNLRTGEQGTDLTQIVLQEPSDLYYLEENGQINDRRTGKTVAKLEDIGRLPNGGLDSYFCDKKLFVQDLTGEDGGPGIDMVRYYVIDSGGNYVVAPKLREPLQMGAIDNSVQFAENTLIVATTGEVTAYTQSGKTTYIKEIAWSAYDVDGVLLGSFSIPEPENKQETTYLGMTDISIKNGIVKLEYIYLTRDRDVLREERHVVYLTKQMQPMFQ